MRVQCKVLFAITLTQPSPVKGEGTKVFATLSSLVKMGGGRFEGSKNIKVIQLVTAFEIPLVPPFPKGETEFLTFATPSKGGTVFLTFSTPSFMEVD